MKAYLDLVRSIFDQGAWQDNRTGVRTLSLPGACLRFDLRQGFPAVTTKRLAFKSAMGELVGFLRAADSAADFRALGCRVWDQNANENRAWLDSPWRDGPDDLGPVYGVQWRQWPAYKLLPQDAITRIEVAQGQGFRVVGPVLDQGRPHVLLYKAVDQLRACLDALIRDPGSRRILFHGWNWAQIDEMALPPCHLLYQFLANPASRELSLCLYIRSNDVGLGTPFNLAEGAALTHLVARLTGYEPRWFTYFIGDAHIYETHVDMLREQLTRDPLPAPRLRLSDRIPAYADTGRYEPEWLERLEPTDFALDDYRHHAPLTAPMAV
ncbi:MAG: thymidylate synthase [Castellaniella sp.]|uniref:thymidylate synthase n=1 Tax=Castellaniella sp. TaxID=1955812 RepID=UPI002A363838|nr:thymidylate synthase [Castellaniella sp.]MDY0308738.1 thymidylate synthase [Castellaniella sp.]